MKTGSEGIEAKMHRRWILFAGFVARMEDTRLSKCVMFGELVGGVGCVGGAGKRVDDVSLGRPQRFRYQRRLVDNCSSSPRRGEMAQGEGARGGTLHGEIDCGRESQGWTNTGILKCRH